MTVLLLLAGPTAVGKTALSLRLAREFSCEIISMDSMQVYRGMDIGTAKATSEERACVRHHLIDIAEPDEQYSAACFVRDATEVIHDIWQRGKIPLVTGGTGLYWSALTKGLFQLPEIAPEIREHMRQRLAREGREALYHELLACDPESANRVHPNDTQRLLRGLEVYAATGRPWSSYLQQQAESPPHAWQATLQLGLFCERDLLYKRIQERTEMIMQAPFRAEVTTLLQRGFSEKLPSMRSLGYRHMIRHLQGEWTLAKAQTALALDTRHYAKRQLTWFRATPDMQWFNRAASEGIMARVACFLKENKVGER